MSYIITICFAKREFRLGLWKEELVQEIVASDASKNLVIYIDKLLSENNLTLDSISKIGFLSGPGSFTSSRIVCATCIGIKTAKPDIIVVPVLLNEAIYSIPEYEDIIILLRCNNYLWHIYDGEWKIIKDEELQQKDFNFYTSMDDYPKTTKPWPDLAYGLFAFTDSISEQRNIEPFYGI